MRKLLSFVAALCITGSMFAGGLVTNTNQSATWVRLPSRNASVGIDAVYFNPAGLMKLENGLHVSLSNQSIWQNRKITNDYSGPDGATGLNTHTFEGTVTAPLFPSVSAVYKLNKIAFNVGFYPVGGGGGALYEQGLPSFEMSPSDLVPSLAAKAGVKGYRLDAYFKGSSTFLGFQGGISYKINDIISVAFGLRYVTAKNTYEGYLKDIQLDMGGGVWAPASTVLTGLAGKLTSITGIPSKLAGAAVNYGTATLAQLVLAGAMTAADKTDIEAGLTAIGAPLGMNINTIRATVTGATPALNDQIATLNANASLVENQSADVAQTGSGITPFFSVNITPFENLNIAIKYEGMTKLELTNKTVQDLTVGYLPKNGSVTSPQSKIPDISSPVTMFPNGAKTRNDMPSMLTFGIDYTFPSSLAISFGMNCYFDKTANYGHKINGVDVSNDVIIDNNGFSVQGGLQYNLSKKLLVSGGYAWANKGVNTLYQSDLTYGLGTQTLGAGGAYNITDKIQLNLGASSTFYRQDSRIVNHVFSSTGTNITTFETYEKSTFMVALGLDISF
jgi:long-chain fatty acid transport protein